MGLLIFEIFHDIQYNTLVWAYNRGRVDRHLGSGRLETLLFGPGVWRIALYTLLVLTYGTLGAVTGYSSTLVPGLLGPTLGKPGFWTGLFVVSAFLHFYFDGFIWQVREKELRQGLGIEGKKEIKGKSDVRPSRPFSRLPSGWKWAFFVLPLTWFCVLELQGNTRPLIDQYRNIGSILPGSGRLHYLVANMEKFERNYQKAMEEYSRSIEVDPDFEPAEAELADVEAFLGLNLLALPHYFRAVELDSLDYNTREHLATTLLRVNRVAEALPHLLVSAPRSPTDTTLLYLTGAALMHEHRPAEAVPYLERTLELDPGQPRAWSYLGMAARLRGDSASAGLYYRRAYALDPQNAWR